MVSFSRVQRNVNSRLSPILAYSRALQCYICRKAFHLRHKKNTSMTMSFDSQKVPSNVIHFRELFCWSPSLLESHMKASALFNNHFTWDICAYFYYNKNKIYFNMYLYNYTHVFSNNNTIINFLKNQLKVVSAAQSVWKLMFREKLCKSGRQFNQLHMNFCRIRSNNWSISPFSILGIVFRSKHRLDELHLWKIRSFKVSLQSQ